jgi:hypothetical protein
MGCAVGCAGGLGGKAGGQGEGGEEPDLVEFIMGHVRQHAPAGGLAEYALCRFVSCRKHVKEAAAPFPASLAASRAGSLC